MHKKHKYSMTPPTTPTHLCGITIAGQHWDIVWLPATFVPDRLGHSDAENQQIVIRANLRGMQALDTLIHEYIHSVSSITGVAVTEEQTHMLGWAMADMWRANPDLVAWAQERIDEEAARDYQARTRAARNTEDK